MREKDEAAHGRYLTRERVLGYMERLAAGDLAALLGALGARL